MVWDKLKVIVILPFLLAGMMFFAGCGNARDKGIEGTWVLVEEFDKNGTKTSSDDLKKMGISEKYEIKQKTVKYTCELPGASKPVEITFELVDLGNDIYEFKMSERITFATVKLDGDTMTYDVGEGDSYSKMVFERQ